MEEKTDGDSVTKENEKEKEMENSPRDKQRRSEMLMTAEEFNARVLQIREQ